MSRQMHLDVWLASSGRVLAPPSRPMDIHIKMNKIQKCHECSTKVIPQLTKYFDLKREYQITDFELVWHCPKCGSIWLESLF